MVEAKATPRKNNITVLHVAGSSESDFYFECSLMYAKAACRFPDDGVKAVYAILRPTDQRWFVYENEIPGELDKERLLARPAEDGGLALPQLLSQISVRFPDVNLVVPHMFDQTGMTTWRQFFQEVLGLPVVGPDGASNAVAQNKLFTRGVLRANGVQIPKGIAVARPASKEVTEEWIDAEVMPELMREMGVFCSLDPERHFSTQELQLQLQPQRTPSSESSKKKLFPIVLKPPLEDNSRGVTLVKKREDLKGALEECFSYGSHALIEEFIPGREFRAGCLNLPRDIEEYRTTAKKAGKEEVEPSSEPAGAGGSSKLYLLPEFIEYVMCNPDMPIRTVRDKFTTDDKGGMCLTTDDRGSTRQAKKCVVRKFVSAEDVSDGLRRKMYDMVLAAHAACNCKDYSLFDFRVHETTGEPYIIEACAFWSFSPISAISAMLRAADLDYRRMILEIWRTNAAETTPVNYSLLAASGAPAKNLLLPGTREDGSASSGNESCEPISEAGSLSEELSPADAAPSVRRRRGGKKEVARAPKEMFPVGEEKSTAARSGSAAARSGSAAARSGSAAAAAAITPGHQRNNLLDSTKMVHRLRLLVHATALIVISAPLLVLYALYAKVFLSKNNEGRKVEVQKAEKVYTVLVTGGKMSKSLHMARSLARLGHKVVLTETHKYRCSGTRFSKAVAAFETVPSPRLDSGEEYLAGLERVFRKYDCDFFVPVSAPVEAVWDARFLASKSRGPKHGSEGSAEAEHSPKNLGFSSSICDILDDKHKFTEWCADELGMQDQMLRSKLIATEWDALRFNRELLEADGCSASCEFAGKSFVLKNLSYDPVHRLDLFTLPCEQHKLEAYLKKVADDGNAIAPERPWQAQQFIKEGKEYTTYAVIKNSELMLITSALSSSSQLRYNHVDEPSCEAWVEKWCSSLRSKNVLVSGQLCWDFMIDDSRPEVARPLECNPRIHSQVCVFADPIEQAGYARSVLGQKTSTGSEPVQPRVRQTSRGRTICHCYVQNEIFFRLTHAMDFLCSKFCSTGAGASNITNGVFQYEIANESAARGMAFVDSDFDESDMLPFFARNLLQPLSLMLDTFLAGNEWKKFDFCIGKVVEKNGD